jgi:hypothetical protein
MTARAGAARSNEIVWAGSGIVIHNSEKLDLINAVTEQGAIYVPVGMTIKSVRSRVRTACGTAAGLAQLKGIVKGGTAYAQQSHATTDVAGTTFEWVLTDAVVPAGEVLFFAGDGGATTTGDCDVIVVLVPAEG